MAAVNVFDYESYRAFLRDYLSEAQRRNKAFSLRAYAQKLHIPASFLSEILSGKKNISVERAYQLCSELGLSADERDYFLKLVECELAKDPAVRSRALQELRNHARPLERHEMDLLQFKMISTWFYIPVLEMATQAHYDGRVEHVAMDLGISPAQLTEALQILIDLKLIEATETGFTKTSTHLMIASENHHKALKEFHSQMLEKAQRALYDQTPQDRYTGSETLMIDPSVLPEAKTIINTCLDQLVRVLNKGTAKTLPYHLQVNFFSLKRKSNGSPS